jgi:Cu+-exporting ATPase
LLAEQGIGLDRAREAVESLQAEGKTALLVAVDGRPAGVLAVADTIKEGAAEAVASLEAQGLATTLLTGDNARTAQAIGHQAGIARVVAEVRPEEKAAEVARLQSVGQVVAMVGDGINDAPALAQADVGIAMGTGTDVAMAAADITLVRGDLRSVPEAIALSRATMRTIKQNLFWAFFYNVILIPHGGARADQPDLRRGGDGALLGQRGEQQPASRPFPPQPACWAYREPSRGRGRHGWGLRPAEMPNWMQEKGCLLSRSRP